MPNEHDKLPPHSQEAEAGILACVLQDEACLDDVQSKLKAGVKSFYDDRHRVVYSAILGLREDSQSIDVIGLRDRLKSSGHFEQVGGDAFLFALPEAAPSTANLSSWLDIVFEKYLLRKLLRYCVEASDRISNCDSDAYSLIAKMQNAFVELETDETKTSDGKASSLGLVEDLQRRFELHSQNKRSGLVTGFHKLDYLTDGLQFGEFSLIGARPSIGKTAIGMNIVKRVCIQDEVPSVIVTLEMSRDALIRRLCADYCSIPMNAIKCGAFTEAQHAAFASFTTMLRNKPLWIIDGVSGLDIAQLAAEVRRLVRKHGVKFVLIDYLQKIKPIRSHEKRTYEVAQASEGLKALARETKTALLSLAQLNRESEKEKGRLPRLIDIGDSGQIERDIDTALLLHRDRSNESNKASLLLVKQRDGETGVIDLEFDGVYCRFKNPPLPAPDSASTQTQNQVTNDN